MSTLEKSARRAGAPAPRAERKVAVNAPPTLEVKPVARSVPKRIRLTKLVVVNMAGGSLHPGEEFDVWAYSVEAKRVYLNDLKTHKFGPTTVQSDEYEVRRWATQTEADEILLRTVGSHAKTAEASTDEEEDDATPQCVMCGVQLDADGHGDVCDDCFEGTGDDDDETAGMIDPSEPNNETFPQKGETPPPAGETTTSGPAAELSVAEKLRTSTVPVTVRVLKRSSNLDRGRVRRILGYDRETMAVVVFDDHGTPTKLTAYEIVSRAAEGSIEAENLLACWSSAIAMPGLTSQPSDRGSDAAEGGKAKKRGKAAEKNSPLHPKGEKSVTNQVTENPQPSPKNDNRKGNRKSAATAEGESRAAADRGAAAAAGPGVELADVPVAPLLVSQLERHPDNREPLAEDVDAIAASYKTDGQLEPIVVRRRPKTDKLQIISGETRWLAAKKNKLVALHGRKLEGISDARALELLALYNAKRKNLDPIQKARMIKRLGDPVEEGGGGLTREAAAKIYGLATGAAASNLVRLLELPDVWQKRVIKEEIPQAMARLLTPYAKSPRLMAAIEADRKEKLDGDSYDREVWTDPAEFEDHLEDVVDDHVRPIDGKTTYIADNKKVSGYWSGPRLFDLTDDLRAKLDVIELKCHGSKKPIEVATNIEVFDKLNNPLIRKKIQASKAKNAAATGRAVDAKSKKLTAAELKAQKKQREEEYHALVGRWRNVWLCRLIAERVTPTSPLFWQLLIVMLTNSDDWEQPMLTPLRRQLGVKNFYAESEKLWAGAQKLRTTPAVAIGSALREALKQTADDFDIEDGRDDGPLPDCCVNDVAAALKIDVAAEWKKLQAARGKPELEIFLLLHSEEALAAIAEEWGIPVLDGSSPETKVANLLRVERVLPLPKAIATLGAKPKAKGTRGKR